MRTGLIAQKLGMTRVFNDSGEHVPVTVLKVEDCRVVAVRTEDRDGYVALQLGVGSAKVKNVSRAARGHFAKARVEPRRKLAEFRVSPEALVDVGAEISVAHFLAGQYVDVSGTSIGKGFAGVIKRHGFSGQRATHGVSLSHRAAGSTGQCQDPGKVFKGKKMAGQMGNAGVTTQNLQVVSTDTGRGLILIKGAVPGAKGGWVLVRDAVKGARADGLPFPAALAGAPEAAAEEAAEAQAEAADVEQPEAEAPEAEAPEAEPADAPATETNDSKAKD